MTKPKILPNKVFLPLAITELGLDKMPILRAIDTILLYSMNDNVSIYFDDQVKGIDSNILIGEMVDDESGYSENFIAEPNQVTIINGKKAITRSNVYSLDNGINFHLSIYGFSQNNISYSIPDESGADLTCISIDYNKVYFDRDKLLEYINEKDFERETRKENQLAKLRNISAPIPPYLDPEHNYYSKWLALAIELHEALHVEGYKHTNSNLEQRINFWLDANKPDLEVKPNMVTKLSTIIGIKKSK